MRDRRAIFPCPETEPLPAPRADIAQTLQVLGRRTADQRLVEAAWPDPPSRDTLWPFDAPCPTLSEGIDESPLTQAEIARFLTRLDTWRNSLGAYAGYRLDLRGANLQRADLSAKRSDASDAVFAGALFDGARMEKATLSRTRMEGADLRRARMEGVKLVRARMEGVALMEVRMAGAELNNARMEGATLFLTGMEGADLSGARMAGSLIFRSSMRLNTWLTATTLQGAALRHVDYTTVRLSAEQVASTFGDASVILPKDIPLPTHWPDWELPRDGDHDFYAEWRKWQAAPKNYTPPPKPEG